jgi:hypothetical protein
MTNVDVQLDRLGIDVQGLSPQLVETAMTGLEGALRSRLGRLRTGRFSDVEVSDLALAPATIDAPTNAEALRSLIVERLVEAMTNEQPGGRR